MPFQRLRTRRNGHAMMRTPTPTARLYAWHRAALGPHPMPMHEGLPECGWYKTRLVKGGPWVPVEICIEREIDPETGELTGPEEYRCDVDGMRRDPARLWTFLTPISRAEFNTLAARREAIPEMDATMVRLDLTQGAMKP